MLATNVGLTLKALQEILSIFKKMSDMRRLHFGNSPLVSERRLDWRVLGMRPVMTSNGNQGQK